MNPTNAFGWEIPLKEFKQNEEQRMIVREDGISENDTETLTKQIEKPEQTKANGALEKARKRKKRPPKDKPVTKKTKVDLEKFEEIDCSEYFVTNEAFSSKEELTEWAKSTGREHDMFLITQSKSGGRVTLTCERYGKARNTGKTDVTKKCQCPFVLAGCKKGDGVWKLKISNGKHNHPLDVHDYSSSLASRLTQEQYETVATLLKNKVTPSKILEHLRQQNPGIKTSLKHIYNARNRMKAEAMNGRTIMQQLMHCIEDDKYEKWHKADPNTGEITDVMFAHRDSTNLLKHYPHVLLMGSTHKTNKYKTSLLEIIGVTPVAKNFNVAVAFLRNESEEHYQWAMENLKSLFDNVVGPNVIVTNMEFGLMKALDCVFPETNHLLCLSDMNENVQINATNLISGKGLGDAFTSGPWKKLVNSQSLQEFETNYTQILREYESNILLLTYLQETWLVHKEKFIHAWTNRVMHFGNTTVTIVESVHSSLKSWLCSSPGKFDIMWKQVDSQLQYRIDEIFSELEKSSKMQAYLLTTYPWSFRNLAGVVTHEALIKMDQEYKIGQSKGMWIYQQKCCCCMRLTHGLPCAHEIEKRERDRNIFYSDEVHLFWRTMVMNDLPSTDCKKVRAREAAKARLVGLIDELRLRPEIEQLKILDVVIPYVQQLRGPQPEKNVSARSSSGSIGCEASALSSAPPQEKTSTKFDFSEFILPFVVPNILSWVDVVADGNCGYRCVAEIVMGNQDHWMKVRNALFVELSDRFDMYAAAFGGGVVGERYVARMMLSLCHWTDTSAPEERWMNLSDMGLVIATHYNAMVLELSGKQNLTHLPLVSPDGFGKLSYVMAIGYEATAKHFVLLRMTDGCPLPPFNPKWSRHKQQSVSYLDSLFAKRCRMWELLSAAM